MRGILGAITEKENNIHNYESAKELYIPSQ
jgi:hypothetical protein